MARTLKTVEGLNMVVLTDSERNALWNELSKDVRFKPTDAQYFADKTKPYYILDEKEVSFEKYETTVKANGKTFVVKSGLLNQDKKIFQAVMRAYQQ